MVKDANLQGNMLYCIEHSKPHVIVNRLIFAILKIYTSVFANQRCRCKCVPRRACMHYFQNLNTCLFIVPFSQGMDSGKVKQSFKSFLTMSLVHLKKKT